MNRGNFEAGLESLGAFESGRPSGDPEQYRIQNTLGFTGKYQFGEALLIDLGYYKADTFYGAGAATNLWQGTWTAKAQAFGVNSIEDFRNSPEIQETAIRDAFEFNWNIIETTLGYAGKTVDDFIGETLTFNDGGTQKSVTITPFGILAGAHLRGPFGLANLLLSGSVSYDEYGTSILRYVDEYAGYDVPADITGGAVTNPPIDIPTNPTEPVDPVAPDPVIPNSGESLVGTDGVQDVFDFTWNWGKNNVIKNFNSSEDTIDLKKFWLPDNKQVKIFDDSQGNAVIDLKEVNNQTITLEGVSKSQLTANNFQGLPDTTAVLDNPPTPPTNPPTSPSLPQLSINDVSIVEGNKGKSNAVFTVELSEASDQAVAVNYSTLDNTANSRRDFIAKNGTIAFAPGETSKTISVEVKGDNKIEPTQDFFVQLDNAINAELLDSQGVGTIVNDDSNPTNPTDPTTPLPTISIDTTSVVEGNSGKSKAIFTVELSAASDRAITVDYSTAEGSANSRRDFIAKNGTLTFAPGETSKTIAIKVKGDTKIEQSEAFYLDLKNAVNADIADNRGDATIINDDFPPTPIDPPTPPTTPSNGQVIQVNENGADVLNFNPATDTIDFGVYSVHSMIITETAQGVAFTSPWNNAEQVLVGISLKDLSIDNFKTIGNAHLREDVAGALAWARGEAVIEPNTVYVRSHEVGKREVVDFNPATDDISFLYYGGRETLKINDTAEGVEISTLATNQSLVLRNVKIADLSESNFEFHFTQVREDHLDNQLGFSVDNAQIIGREGILIPGGDGPTMPHNHPDGHNHTPDSMMMMDSTVTLGQDRASSLVSEADNDLAADNTGIDGQKDIFSFTWNWGDETVIDNFNPNEDSIDLQRFWTDYNNVSIIADGNNTVIDLSTINNQKIILQGVSPDQLKPNNINGVAGEFPLANNPGNPTEPTTPALPTLSIDDVSILEGDSGKSRANFTVELSAASDQAITVNYATVDNSANSRRDFVAKNGTLTFAPGETTKNISVRVKGDTKIEQTENFSVQLDNAVNANILDNQGIGTIRNDDRAPNTGGNSQPIVGAYYPEWAIYDRDYQVTDLPADKLTHAFYAFAKIDDQGKVGVFDSWAATDKRFDGNWNTPKEFAGNFEQLNNVKNENPHLKTLISIGGWTLSGKFSDVALTDTSRETFAKSAVDFMTKYGFDGIDIDWEYPVSGGLAGNTYRPEDKHNYTLLLGELDEQLKIQEAQDNQDYLLTIASPAGFDKIENYELGAMSQYLDFFNVMAYDYHGAWENTTGHNAPLYANPNDPSANGSKYNVDYTIQTYLNEGVPADKIVLGAPAYGRTWTGVGSDSNGLFQSATGAGEGTWEKGVIDYNDLYNKVQTDSNYQVYWDDASKVPYVHNAQTGFFSTYENVESMSLKLDYIKQNQLGGTFFWDASSDIRDSNDPNSLIGLAASELGVVTSKI